MFRVSCFVFRVSCFAFCILYFVVCVFRALRILFCYPIIFYSFSPLRCPPVQNSRAEGREAWGERTPQRKRVVFESETTQVAYKSHWSINIGKALIHFCSSSLSCLNTFNDNLPLNLFLRNLIQKRPLKKKRQHRHLGAPNPDHAVWLEKFTDLIAGPHWRLYQSLYGFWMHWALPKALLKAMLVKVYL